MPAKRRVSKRRAFAMTPEILAAFDAGDENALRRALNLPPWHASPLWTDLDGSPPYGPSNLLVNGTRAGAMEIRREIITALGRDAG